MQGRARIRGFTLIELSIALVVIGLIVGGVLVGRNLVRAAEVRAQITQIERYQAATNTFRDKYGYLPGDINNQAALQFGFAARGLYAGEGDGNGLIEGIVYNLANSNYGWAQGAGETGMFWVDLSMAGLIEGGYNNTGIINHGNSTVIGTGISAIIPAAKMGDGNYVYVYSDSGINYYGLSAVYEIYANSKLLYNGPPGLTTQQAYTVDAKTDDGLPQSGHVLAAYIYSNNPQEWAVGSAYGGPTGGPYTTATPSSSFSCFDNNNTPGEVQQYSISSTAVHANCALSFKFN